MTCRCEDPGCALPATRTKGENDPMRYLVIEILCLECTEDGKGEPRVIVTTDSLDDARASASKPRPSREYDRFIVDTRDRAIITVPH